MSRTIRAYNKPTYFRRRQQPYEFRWTFIPPYHPYRQDSWSDFKCWDYGVTKKYLSKLRRLRNQQEMLTELLNTFV